MKNKEKISLQNQIITKQQTISSDYDYVRFVYIAIIILSCVNLSLSNSILEIFLMAVTAGVTMVALAGTFE